MPDGSILVADDDAAIRTVLNQALSRAGYEVRSTGNAATLWRWISQGDGDLIISDVLLPDENAFDLLPRIKKARPELPIIVMSAYEPVECEHVTLWLPKQYLFPGLVEKVHSCLSAPDVKSLAK